MAKRSKAPIQGVCGVVQLRRGTIMIRPAPSPMPYIVGGLLGLFVVWVLRLFL